MWHWLEHVLGMDNLSGPWYGFWSGFGSDLGEVTLLGGLYILVRGHNCHEHRCWRIGRHAIEGTPFKVCRKHHPQIDETKPLRIADHHLAAHLFHHHRKAPGE